MTKVRTIKETIKELRAIDPGCQLTEWQLRQLVKEEKIPAMMADSPIFTANLSPLHKSDSMFPHPRLL